MNVTAAAAGNVSFYIYGSSEEGWDYLYINQNGSQIWSSKGTDYTSWTLLTFPVSAGTTTFAFTYYKDSSNSYDLDKYCVDYLSAPGGLVPNNSQTGNPSNKTCNSDCTLGSGACYNGWCGDGTTQSTYEACDSGSSNNDSWASSSSTKHCNANCTGWAPYCGDGAVNGSEQCDGGSTDCSNVGDYNQGTATCTGSCTWNTTNCSKSSGGGGC